MNIPNKVTMGRLFLTGLFVAVMSIPSLPYHYTLAFTLFLIASATDFLDGYLARKWELVTDFGKLMDPLADKILTGAVFIFLSSEGIVPAWCTILIIAREFLVTGLRLIASAQGAVLAADQLGKWKTTFQIITACYFLAAIGNEEPLLAPLGAITSIGWLGACLTATTVFLTVVSGLSYLRSNREIIKTS